MPSSVPGGPAGDLYVSIRTRTDPRFSRVGADLWYDLHIQPPDAALGVITAVPLPGGQARVRVPPGTQHGSVLRVPGKGLPRYDGDGRGSLHLRVILDIPRQLSPPQRQLYEQLRAADARRMPDGSRQPDVPRADRRVAAIPDRQYATPRGMLIFASLLLLVVGAVNLIGGIAVVSGAQLPLAGTQYGFSLRIWGWVMIIFGAVQLLGAAGVWVRRQSLRIPSRSG
jgi:hypothetical protein